MIYYEDIRLYQIAQAITDEMLGEGSYVALNRFDPSKGEMYARYELKDLPDATEDHADD